MGRTILVGDVHGCVDELRALLEQCEHSKDDQVILVGDLVAKGPDSAGVVQFARESGFGAVLGNHDEHVLTVAKQGAPSGKREHHALVAATLGASDLEWLGDRPLWMAPRVAGWNVLVVHGGFIPGVPLSAQPRKYLLNLRSIHEDGSPSRRIDGAPWASLWKGPAHVVFGHDALRGLQQHAFATGLDTGCVYGQRLTALILPENRIVSVAAKRAYSSVAS
jgi:predicted phosphodiesterase